MWEQDLREFKRSHGIRQKQAFFEWVLAGFELQAFADDLVQAFSDALAVVNRLKSGRSSQ